MMSNCTVKVTYIYARRPRTLKRMNRLHAIEWEYIALGNAFHNLKDGPSVDGGADILDSPSEKMETI